MAVSFNLYDCCNADRFRFTWRNAAGEDRQHAVRRLKARRKGWTKEIVRAQAIEKMQREQGLTASPTVLAMTLADYGRQVLTADRVSDHVGKRVQASTGSKDLECWNSTVCNAKANGLPNIAALPMKAITRPVLIEFLTALRGKDGWSDNYKGTISHKLRIVMRRAVDREAVPADCHGSRMAGKWISTDSEKSVRAQPLLTVEQVIAARAYFNSLRSDVARMIGLLRFEMALCTGARPGEWLGLRAADLTWLDHDPDFCAVWTVRHAMGTRKDEDGKDVAYIKPTKTKAGNRTLFIPAYLHPLLRAWMATQSAIRETTTVAIDPDQQFLLTNQWGTLTTKQVMTGWWSKARYGARYGAGLPTFTLYNFRSSFAANFRLANGGVTLALKQLMGHVAGGVTEMYASTDDKSAEQLAQRAELVKLLHRINGTRPAPQPAPVAPASLGGVAGLVIPVPANDDSGHSIAV
jgi:integrase